MAWLFLLGASVLYRLWRNGVHFHWHRHDFPMRALLVGMVHGMASSAALILLSLEAVDSIARGFGCIAIFGFGSILGMALLSVAIAVPLLWAKSGTGAPYR